MPRKPREPYVQQLDFDDVEQENTDLREKPTRDEVLDTGQSGDSDMRPGWFLITVAVLVVGRVVLFYLVENEAVLLPVTPWLNGLFTIVGAVVLVKWHIATWDAIAWGVVSKSAFVLISLACAVTSIKDHPYGSVVYVILALVFAASPGWELMMGMLLVFVHHPLETIERLKRRLKRKHEIRRKN